jgi:ubiquitin-activating enzyme E1 C
MHASSAHSAPELLAHADDAGPAALAPEALTRCTTDVRMKHAKSNLQILVVGAGAIGCEALRALALCGFRNLVVLDRDTVAESNLNRQTLYSSADVGASKALRAAQAIKERFPGCTIRGYWASAEQMPVAFYRAFDVIVSGVDTVEARRWLNTVVFHVVRPVTSPNCAVQSKYLPVLIDGGLEGLAGQVRTIRPYETPCIECILDLFPDEAGRQPLCTIAGTPLRPEHCIHYAQAVLWPARDDQAVRSMDPENPEHLEWIYTRAQERAAAFGIEGVTTALVKAVLHRSVPALATTSAVTGAACALAVTRLVWGGSHAQCPWTSFHGSDGLYIDSIFIERRLSCPVCGPGSAVAISVSKNMLVKELIELLERHPVLHCRSPTIVWDYRPVYMSVPQSLKAATSPNLERPLSDIFISDSHPKVPDQVVLSVTDTDTRTCKTLHLFLT